MTHTQVPNSGIQFPKTLRTLAEAAIATAAIALMANLGAAGATTEQHPQSQIASEASALQVDGTLQASFGYGPVASLEGDIDPNAATRQRVAAEVNSAELDIRAVDGVALEPSGQSPVVRLIEVEL